MSGPQLSVSITGELTGLRQALRQGVSETNSATGQMINSVGQLDRSFSLLNNTRFTFGQNFRQQATLVTAATRPIVSGANQAGNALTNLGRVAQDAPFGFIGIQNNLNPLLESFQRLRAETGSNAAALRALGQSFLGPAGLGVALSLITAGITFYTMYQQKANKATNDAKKGTDDYIDTLDQLTQAQVRGASNAQKELTELTTLYSVTQNTTLSLKNRKDAVDELQSKYPEYFKNLSDESILNGKAKTAYDQLTESIIATARARAAQDLITKNSSRQLVNEKKIADLEKQKLKDQLALDRAVKRGAIAGSIANAGSAGVAESTVLKETQAQINNLKTDTNKLTEINLKLTESINGEIRKGADLTGKLGASAKEETDKIAEIYKELAIQLKKNQVQFSDTPVDIVEANIQAYQKALDGLTENGYAKASKAVQDLIDKQNELVKQFIATKGVINGTVVSPNISNPSTTTNSIVDKPILSKQLPEYIKLAQQAYNSTVKFEEGLKSLSSESIAGGISSAFSAIGEAFATGTSAIDAFGEAIIGAFASFLSQLGQMFIKQGIASIAFGSALSLNPLTAVLGKQYVASGIGQVAAGALISVAGGAIGSAGKKGKSNSSSQSKPNIPQFASGVNNFSGGMALVGERGPEFVNLPTGSSVTPNFRTSQMMSENRQDTNVFIDGQLRADARGIYLALETEGKKLGRRGYGK